MTEDRVIIKVSVNTREKLKAIGKKGDTYEDVITWMFAELERENITLSQGIKP